MALGIISTDKETTLHFGNVTKEDAREEAKHAELVQCKWPKCTVNTVINLFKIAPVHQINEPQNSSHETHFHIFFDW